MPNMTREETAEVYGGTIRKPHNGLAGYRTERVCQAACGGWIVIYDRARGFDCDADYRYIVMHEPSSVHVAVSSMPMARDLMYTAAAGDLANVFGEDSAERLLSGFYD